MRRGDRITNTTVLSDPVFLSEPMVRSTDFYRLPVDPGAWLYACDDGEQILDRPEDDVPNYLFGRQPFVREFSERYGLPFAASRPFGGRVTLQAPAPAAVVSSRSSASTAAAQKKSLTEMPPTSWVLKRTVQRP